MPFGYTVRVPSAAFYEHTLPLMFTILIAAAGAMWSVIWSVRGLEKRVDQRLDAIEKRLERIEQKLDNHADRISRLEERVTLIRT